MRFAVLGPVMVELDGARVSVNSPMPRTLLAVLLLQANAPVSADQLVEALWGGRPPASAIPSLHNHVMRLRKLLGEEGAARIRAAAPGYLIQVEPGELDLQVFDDLCASGRAAGQAGQWARAAEDFSAALGLWRGEFLADVPKLSAWQARVQHLTEARLQALAGRLEADLRLGRHSDVIGELQALVIDHPLREDFHGQLMLALYRAGRQAEALEAFQRLRRTLVDELAVEPSPQIQELHRRILTGDSGLAAAAAPSDPVAPSAADRGALGPRFQLPADTRLFTGRARELGTLLSLARTAPEGSDAGMVVISAIDGMGGIGKSALAVHVGHQVRELFPDWQLFIDLHGYTAGLDPLTSGDALEWLLRSLGVPPESIPQDLDLRAAYYRDRLVGTRTLIILDNASSAAQVRPLLPATAGCMVLITSRRNLTGLDDAHFLALDVLPEADAIALLVKVATPERVPADHPALPELIALCGRMPLAIRIVAARLRHQRSLRIEDLVTRLRDDIARIGHLADEDRNLTAVFDLSHASLLDVEQLLLRRLGLVPGPDFDAYAATSLIGCDHRTGERHLESLMNHSLLVEHAPGRYRFHDLVRVYARSLCAREFVGDRDAALDRLYDYYEHTAQTADSQVSRSARAAAPRPLAPPVAAPSLGDRTAAVTWMRAERDNLLACAIDAAARDQAQRVSALSACMAAFLQQDSHWSQADTLHRTAASTARKHGDRLNQAHALLNRGKASSVTGDYPTAVAAQEQALAIFQDLGDLGAQARTLMALGRDRLSLGDWTAAIDLKERALAVFRELGDPQGEANALGNLSRALLATGELPRASDALGAALVIYQGLGDRLGEANVLADLGRTRYMTGDYPATGELHERALAIYRQLGSRHGEAMIFWELGRVRLATGDFPAAAAMFEQAHAEYEELGIAEGAADSLTELGRVRLATGDHAAADALQKRTLAVYQELGQRQGEANVLWDQGRLCYATGDYVTAADLMKQALDIFEDIGDRKGSTDVLISTGALVARTDGPTAAQALYRRASDLAQQMHSRIDQARALEGAARCAASLGDHAAALAELSQAVSLYRLVNAAETNEAARFLAVLERGSQGDAAAGA